MKNTLLQELIEKRNNLTNSLEDIKINPLVFHVILWILGLGFFLFGLKEIIKLL